MLFEEYLPRRVTAYKLESANVKGLVSAPTASDMLLPTPTFSFTAPLQIANHNSRFFRIILQQIIDIHKIKISFI